MIGVSHNRVTNEIKPITLGGKGIGPINKPGSITGEKPLDVSRDRTNNLNEAYDRHPEWKEFLNKRGTAIVIGKRPEASYSFNPFGANTETTTAKQAEWDRMMDFIYGTTTPKQTNQSNDTQKTPPSMMSRFGIPSPNAVSPETTK